MAETDASCDSDPSDAREDLPLLSAVQKGHTECAHKLILSNMAEERHWNLDSMAFNLICDNDSGALECLLKAAAEAKVRIYDVYDAFDEEESLLNIAVGNNDEKTVAVLVKYGALINYDIWNPLSKAVRGGFTEIVRILLEAGAKTYCFEDRRVGLLPSAIFRQTLMKMRKTG